MPRSLSSFAEASRFDERRSCDSCFSTGFTSCQYSDIDVIRFRMANEGITANSLRSWQTAGVRGKNRLSDGSRHFGAKDKSSRFAGVKDTVRRCEVLTIHRPEVFAVREELSDFAGAVVGEIATPHEARTRWYSATPLLGSFLRIHDLGSALLTVVLGEERTAHVMP